MKSLISKKWRDASTLIVLAKKTLPYESGSAKYDILVQTRPQKASTFANSVVFPGGVYEPADCSPDWIKLIKSFGYSQENFEALHHPSEVISPLFSNDPVQRHVSLRITAIRETFEELGILLGSSLSKDKRAGLWANVVSGFDVSQWQSRVRSNPGELLNLYRELNCYPDIWCLHFWSNWLTPQFYKKRFDTAFFVTALENKPDILKDKNEVGKVQWASPENILNRNKKGELVLFPPQSYELYRLSHVSDLEELMKFAAERSKYDNTVTYPVRYDAEDGFINVLPGDDLYPKDVKYFDLDTISRKDSTVLQLREGCHTLHRFEYTATRKEFITRNLNPKHHISIVDTTMKVNAIM